MSITNRLRWSYLITSTLPLLLVGALLITVLLQVQQRNAFATQQAVADRIAGNIATFLYDLEQQLLRAARELRPDDRVALAASAQRLVNSSPDLRAITVLNANGEQVANSTSDLLRAQEIMPAPVDQALIGDAISVGQGGRTAITRGDDGQPRFQIVLPVRDPQSGRISGALAAEVSAARLRQILRLGVQGEARSVYLIDAERTVQLSDAVAGWRPPPSLEALFRDGQTVAEYPGGDSRLVLGARAPVAPVTATSWSVVVEQPSAEFFVEVYRSLILLAALVALVGALGLTWALYQARRLVNPIKALTAGAQALAGGHLQHRIDVEPGDELGQLASAFNQMAEQLQRSLSEIERQNEHLRHGLILARDIQQGLLPGAPPWRSEILSVCGRSLPASEVGGDFYTYLTLPGGRVAIAIGDISGKGVAAALLMALASSTLESQAHHFDRPAELLRAMHEALRPRLEANHMNAALLVAVFADDTRTMTVANAGMIAPLLVPGGADGLAPPRFIEVGGLPIGTAISGRYHEATIDLAPGDTVLFLSDGIVEAHNREGELYGFERLERLVAELPPELGVSGLVQRIIDAVLAFVGDADPHDDITIIATRPGARVAREREAGDARAHPEPAGARR
ncbi:MAG: hypothetical protein OHK0015_22590 [Chloroflexi bacterium OHK40]